MRSLNLPPQVEHLLQEYLTAVDNKRQWNKEAERLRTLILGVVVAAGYSVDKKNLNAERLQALAGNTVFEVRPIPTERLDLGLLKAKYPQVYKDCLSRTTTYKVAIPDVSDDDDGEQE